MPTAYSLKAIPGHPGYVTKLSDSKGPDLEICGFGSTSSLSLVPSLFRPGVVGPDRVLFMGQIEQTACKQITDVKG